MTASRGIRRRQVIRDGRLRCIGCDEWKPLDGFHHKRNSKTGRTSRCKECSLTRHRRYYVEHRATRIAYQQARRNADVEAALAYERQVYARRREKAQATNKARERGMKPLDRESLAYQTVLHGDPCCYCGRPAKQIDHIEPVATDGENHWTNLTAACRRCNRAKSAKPLLAALAA